MPSGGKHPDMEAWDACDDMKLLHLVEVYGPKWTFIAGEFPANRTVSSVRNRFQRIRNGFHTGIMKKKNKCSACGCPKRGTNRSLTLPLSAQNCTFLATRLAHFLHTHTHTFQNVLDWSDISKRLGLVRDATGMIQTTTTVAANLVERVRVAKIKGQPPDFVP